MSTTTVPADTDLIDAVASGDETALAALYDRHAALVYSLAKRMLRSAERAEDVLQDVFTQVWQRAGSFDVTRGSVAAWLVVLTRSRTIDELRLAHTSREIPMDASGPLFDVQDSTVVAPDDRVIGAIRSERVRKAVSHLSEPHRVVIMLAYFDGRSQTEIAEIVGVPLGTVKTRMYHGLLRLREFLGSSGWEGES